MPGTILHQLLTERGRRRTFQITNATWPNNTYPEIVSAERNLASARSVSHDTRSAIYTTASAVALSTGDLARQPREQLDPYRGENETNNFEIRWCYPGAARRLLRCGADGQPPFTDYRSSRLLFSGMDGLHC